MHRCMITTPWLLTIGHGQHIKMEAEADLLGKSRHQVCMYIYRHDSTLAPPISKNVEHDRPTWRSVAPHWCDNVDMNTDHSVRLCTCKLRASGPYFGLYLRVISSWADRGIYSHVQVAPAWVHAKTLALCPAHKQASTPKHPKSRIYNPIIFILDINTLSTHTCATHRLDCTITGKA